MDEEIFIDLNTHERVTNIKDVNEIVKISDKSVKVDDIGTIVRGESNSTIIEFEIDRYYDKVDLIDKTFYIIYKTSIGTYKTEAINYSYSEKHMRFNWLIDDTVTVAATNVIAAISVEGKLHDKDYMIKTVPFKITVTESLDETGVTPSDIKPVWLKQLEERLEKMEQCNYVKFYQNDDAFNDAVAAGLANPDDIYFTIE